MLSAVARTRVADGNGQRRRVRARRSCWRSRSRRRCCAPAPVSLWDGFLYADALSALVILLNASVALVCSVYAVGYLREDERSGTLDEEAAGARKLRKYYSLTPLFVFSMLLVTLANNLGVMWAAIEVTTLASVFLVTFYGKVTSLEAAWKYAIIGGVGPLDGAVRHHRSPTMRATSCRAPTGWPG